MKNVQVCAGASLQMGARKQLSARFKTPYIFHRSNTWNIECYGSMCVLVCVCVYFAVSSSLFLSWYLSAHTFGVGVMIFVCIL